MQVPGAIDMELQKKLERLAAIEDELEKKRMEQEEVNAYISQRDAVEVWYTGSS